MIKKLSELEKVCVIAELAKELNVTANNIRQQIKNGTIPERFYVKSGGTYIFHKDYIQWHKLNKQYR